MRVLTNFNPSSSQLTSRACAIDGGKSGFRITYIVRTLFDRRRRVFSWHVYCALSPVASAAVKFKRHVHTYRHVCAGALCTKPARRSATSNNQYWYSATLFPSAAHNRSSRAGCLKTTVCTYIRKDEISRTPAANKSRRLAFQGLAGAKRK